MGNDEDEALTVDGSDGDVFAAARQTQKACVESALLQHSDLIGGADVEQIQSDARMVAAKGEDDERDELQGRRGDEAYLEMPGLAGGNALRVGLGFIRHLQYSFRAAEECLARLGESDDAAIAREKLDAELSLKGLDLGTKSGLRNVELA